MASKLTTLTQQKTAAELQTMSRKSIAWLKNKITEIGSLSRVPAGIINDKSRQAGFQIGGLHFFYYDPKGRATLPYYDQFPLVLVLEASGDGFLGLNLHYLPVDYRVAFLDKLMGAAVLDKNKDITRLRISYDILSASKRLKEFKPCIKKYLFSQVKSRIIAIQPNEWDVAIMLPVQQFKKATSSKVWQESLEEIGQ